MTAGAWLALAILIGLFAVLSALLERGQRLQRQRGERIDHGHETVDGILLWHSHPIWDEETHPWAEADAHPATGGGTCRQG